MKHQWSCPATEDINCLWAGERFEVLSHFQTAHENLTLRSNTFSVDVTSNKNENRILRLGKDVYLIQTNVEPAKRILELKLRYLGSHEEALALSYTVQVSAGDAASFTPELCNAVNIKDGSVQVDLHLLCGTGSQEYVVCTVEVHKRVKEDELDVKQPLAVASVVDSNAEVAVEPEEEPVEDIAPLVVNKNPSPPAMNFTRNASVVRNDSRRLSFLKNYFFDDLASTKSVDTADNEGIDGKSPDAPQCATCLSEMHPPIFLCFEGHSVCSECKFKTCGICAQSITDLRNTDLEDISMKLKQPCKYASNGCVERLKFEEIQKHEITCGFCVYKCCLCNAKGKFSEMKTHFKIFHSSVRAYEYLKNKFPKNTSFAIINRDSGVFYCVSKQKEENVEWSVTFCGPKERWFGCELKFKGKKEVSYSLKRNFSENSYQLILNLNDLKTFGVKDKHAVLVISSC